MQYDKEEQTSHPTYANKQYSLKRKISLWKKIILILMTMG